MTFGEKLRNARKKKKLTQKELAEKIMAKHNSISNWENDQNMPDPDTIQHLCWALDVQPNYFFSTSDDANFQERGSNAQYNVIRIAGRDGSYLEKHLNDEQLAAVKAIIDQLPDASDDI